MNMQISHKFSSVIHRIWRYSKFGTTNSLRRISQCSNVIFWRRTVLFQDKHLLQWSISYRRWQWIQASRYLTRFLGYNDYSIISGHYRFYWVFRRVSQQGSQLISWSKIISCSFVVLNAQCLIWNVSCRLFVEIVFCTWIGE